MPKDEFDFEDPFELNGMAFLTHEDTTDKMAECFTEEFMRMGYGHKQVLALFQNPHYLGPNMAYEKHGEPFIRDLITDVFARWGKPVTWPAFPPKVDSDLATDSLRGETVSPMHFRSDVENRGAAACAPQETEHDANLTDPMGAPIPKLNA